MMGKKRLFKSVYLPYPPEDVWVALTDPHALAEWLMPSDFKAELGHEFTFHTDPAPGCGTGVTHCKVIELEPHRKLTMRWQHDPNKKGRQHPPMRIEFNLLPMGEGTRLTLTQTGLKGQPFLTLVLMNIGWGFMLKRLLPKVTANVHREGEEAEPRFRPGAIPLAKRTYKVKSVPDTHIY